MFDSPQRPKVTIEELLRLKRAERPTAEFWTNFEHELRQKQLAALLEKRPWWQELPRLFARRAYLPVGATAILAFTLVSIKFYAPTDLAPADVTVGSSTAPVSPPAVADVDTVIPQGSSPLLNRNDQTASRMDDRVSVAALESEMPVEVTASVEAPMLRADALQIAETPSARSIAANLARLEQSEPELINAVVGSRLSSPPRVQTASVMTGELASLPTSASRRHRLLAQYTDRQLGPEPTAPDIVRERLSRRLGDPDINDRIGRLGLRGDAVSLKF